MKTRVQNRLGQVRRSRGIGASDLARRVRVSRQTIYAIEAGTYVPNTEVALNLASELEVTVDELFSLQAGSRKAPESLAAEVLSAAVPAKGQPVRICQIGSRWVSVPASASPYYMPEADGIIKRPGRMNGRADLIVFAKDEAAQKRLVLAGCDPATGLFSHMVEKISGVEIVSAAASSKLALRWLSEGKVHIAGSHLEDPKTGEFNLPFLRKEFPGEDFSVDLRALGRRVGDLGRKSQRNSQSGGLGAKECPICKSRVRLGKPRPAGQTLGKSRHGRAQGARL